MIRLVIFEILVFALPFAAYALYGVFLNKRDDGERFWKGAPLYNLCLSGFALVAAGILGYGLYWS